MVPTRRIVANKANAQRSTGPRSPNGKAVSRLNALKHGLSRPASVLPDWMPQIAQIAHALTAETGSHPQFRDVAQQVAEAVVDVLRVRKARLDLLSRMALDADPLILDDGQAANSVSEAQQLQEIAGSHRPSPSPLAGAQTSHPAASVPPEGQASRDMLDLQIPISFGQGFRDEAGRDSDQSPATVPR